MQPAEYTSINLEINFEINFEINLKINLKINHSADSVRGPDPAIQTLGRSILLSSQMNE